VERTGKYMGVSVEDLENVEMRVKEKQIWKLVSFCRKMHTGDTRHCNQPFLWYDKVQSPRSCNNLFRGPGAGINLGNHRMAI